MPFEFSSIKRNCQLLLTDELANEYTQSDETINMIMYSIQNVLNCLNFDKQYIYDSSKPTLRNIDIEQSLNNAKDAMTSLISTLGPN